MNKKFNSQDELRELIEKNLSHWKWFIFSVLCCLVLAFLFLRYSTKEYGIEAIIRVNDNLAVNENVIKGYNQSNQSENNNDAASKLNDEIVILKSRPILKKVVEDLNLNIQIFGQGKLKAIEFYNDPPITVNFLSNDSIIHNVDTTLTIHIDSKSKYLLEKDGRKLNFGEKTSTTFGDIVVTPNVENAESLVERNYSVKISKVEKTITSYGKKLKFTTGGEDSNMITISIVDPIKEKGIAFIDILINAYNERIVTNKNKLIDESSSFINKRLQVVSSELSQVDLTAETIKKDNRLTDLSSQSSIYLQSEREIENEQVATSTQLRLIDYMKNYLQENNSSGDVLPANMSFEDKSINETLKQHNELVLQRNRILKNSSEINPVVINLDEQINNLKQSLLTSLSNIESSNLIKLEALNKEDARISSKIYSAPKKERQFRDLNRQQNIKESLYLYLLQKREEAAIANGIASPNAAIVNDAHASELPVYPKRTLVLIAAIIVGLVIPAIVIYVHDFLDNKIHGVDTVKNLTTIPILGEIPKSKTKQTVIKKVDYSPIAEAFRHIRTNIEFLLSGLPKNEGKVVFVTSTTSQEGKSYTTINLAKSLSFSNKKVLVIETDIRVPKANKYLKVDNKIGLSDYLVNDRLELSQVVNKISDNLYMMPSGTLPPNPAELLMSDKIKTLFENVRKHYDYIIVDTSAIGLVTDTLVIGKHADLFVYVVRANYLDKRQLRIAQTAYEEKRLPNMTILLNGVSAKKGYGYGYGYGSDSTKKKSKWKLV